MSNTNALIDELGLRGVTSVNQAIVQVSEFLSEKSTGVPARLLNKIGVEAPSHPVEADIMLKAVVEMIIKGTFAVPADAHAYGLEKIAAIKAKMPYVFTVADPVTDENGEVQHKRSKGASNDKNAKSITFVREMFGGGERDRGVITNKLAEELGTDYAGAYFYVKKAEKELKIELTAVRGRKAVKKVQASE